MKPQKRCPAGTLKAMDNSSYHSRFSNQAYNITIRHLWRIIRLAGMVVIAVVLTGRCLMLFIRSMHRRAKPKHCMSALCTPLMRKSTSGHIAVFRATPRHMAILAILALSANVGGLSMALGAGSAAWLLDTALLLAQLPEENLGHRAGAQGFAGESSRCPGECRLVSYHCQLAWSGGRTHGQAWADRVSACRDPVREQCGGSHKPDQAGQRGTTSGGRPCIRGVRCPCEPRLHLFPGIANLDLIFPVQSSIPAEAIRAGD